AVLAGIALTRSGLPDSVHAFSSGAAVAALFALAALVAAASTAAAARHGRAAPAGRAPSRRARWAERLLGWGVGWVLVVVAAGGIAAAVLGVREPPAAVDGAALARLVAPVGALLVLGGPVLGFRRGDRRATLGAAPGP